MLWGMGWGVGAVVRPKTHTWAEAGDQYFVHIHEKNSSIAKPNSLISFVLVCEHKFDVVVPLVAKKGRIFL